jgi:hypothetical protein
MGELQSLERGMIPYSSDCASSESASTDFRAREKPLKRPLRGRARRSHEPLGSSHGRVPPHDGSHHRPGTKPRVLRGAGIQVLERHGHRARGPARGNELLLLDRRPGERPRADVQPRWPFLRARHRVRPRRHRRRRPRRHARDAGERARYRARAAPYQVREGGSRICFVRDPDR